MKRSPGWLLALAAVLLTGCIGPFADTFDEAVQDTPADYDECCIDADRTLLGRLAGTGATVASGGGLAGVRVDAVVTTRRFDDAVEKDVSWGKDGDGLIAPDDTHDYVLALVARPAGADPKVWITTVVTVFAEPGDAGRAVYESSPLVDPQNGDPVRSMIIAVRVPEGHTVLLTAGDPRPGGPAVDLRTGRAAKFPAGA
ncbi:hypothetical protein [Dactylosporangium sp. NPDC005555]|uniref:hypothetical protein n=1 Tax=Dactylosporangium sp. NPDC005555 TaxID=3154889 RepID=UPI0033BB744F